jgi:hypothetical protein
MTGLHAFPHGSETQDGRFATNGMAGRYAFLRYLLLSSGISSTALGLALIVSALASAYADSSAGRMALAAGSAVIVRGERGHSSLLDSAHLNMEPPEPVLEAAALAFAPEAPPLLVEPAAEVASPLASVAAVRDETPSITEEAWYGEYPATEVPPPVQAPEVTAQLPPRSARDLPAIGRVRDVNLTFYDCLEQGFCGAMYSGTIVYEGAAACSWDLPIGTRFTIEGDPTGRIYVCEDRGLLDDTWVDIYFHDPVDGWAWQRAVGRYGTIEIVELP